MSKEHYKTSPVIGYIRSAKKADPKLDKWEARIHRYANERGYNLVGVLREEGVSGVTSRRPLLEQLIHGVIAGEYAGVLVVNITHFASGTEAHRIQTKITKNGVWIESLNL